MTNATIHRAQATECHIRGTLEDITIAFHQEFPGTGIKFKRERGLVDPSEVLTLFVYHGDPLCLVLVRFDPWTIVSTDFVAGY